MTHALGSNSWEILAMGQQRITPAKENDDSTFWVWFVLLQDKVFSVVVVVVAVEDMLLR
jgi:hypothetical protein